jgi:hypothetical protein
MRTSSPIQLANAASMATSVNSKGMQLFQGFVYSIQAIWVGAGAAGDIKIQVSNDNVVPVQYSSMGADASNPAANVVNWIDYPATDQTIAGAGQFMWNFSDTGYAWVRVVFTASGGSSGSLTINAWIKGG